MSARVLLRLAGAVPRLLPLSALTVPAAAVGRVRCNQQATADSWKFDPLDVTRRRLLYRSKQRGW